MTEFRPKYRKGLWIGVFFFPPSLVFLGPQVFENPAKDPKLTVSWFIIFLVVSLVPFILIKRIKLEDQWFIVERYFGSGERIMYGDVMDVGSASIKYRGGMVKLTGIINVAEFIKSLSEKIDLREMEDKI